MLLCADRRGELTDLPVGPYHIIIQGVVAGEKTWRGEVSEVQVNLNETTDVGPIHMVHLYDQVAPTVVETFPTDGALDMAVNSKVSATFDEAIVLNSIGVENFTLTFTDPLNVVNSVDCTVDYNPGSSHVELSPAVPLVYDTTYTATIAVDRTLMVEDLAGNPMQQTKQWTFKTLHLDAEAPNLTYRSPAVAEMDVASTAKVVLEFSEPVRPGTITTESIHLKYEGADVPYHLDFDESHNRVTLSPINALKAGSTYTVIVSTIITDLDGNPLAADDSWSFVTRFAPWRHESLSGLNAISDTVISKEPDKNIHISYINIEDEMVDAKRITENNFLIGGLVHIGKINVSTKPQQDMVITSAEKHVICLEEGRTSLTVCTYSGAFICYQVDDSNALRGGAIAALKEPPGKPSICYYDGNSAQIKYATVTESAVWEIETIDNGGYTSPSIALAPSGSIHVSYNNADSNQLKYAAKIPGGSWVTEFVDPSVTASNLTDIAVDKSGNPHICYRDVEKDALKYATKQTSGDWLIETVDQNDSTIGSIALDSLGNAHISYSGFKNNVLKYASRTSLGLWHTHIVDNPSVGFIKNGTSIIVDTQDYVHVSYLYAVGVSPGIGSVKYATNSPVD